MTIISAFTLVAALFVGHFCCIIYTHLISDVGVTSYAVYPGVAKTQLSRGLAKSNVSSAVFKPSELLMR